jgi:hypothetical protein
VLTDKDTVGELGGQRLALAECEAERRTWERWPPGSLRMDSDVHVLAPVAVRPIEGALLHHGEIVRDQVRANLVPLVWFRLRGTNHLDSA